MKCNRCRGMMVLERYYTDGHSWDGWRCVRCGNIEDELILQNRSFIPSQDNRGRRKREETEIPMRQRCPEHGQLMPCGTCAMIEYRQAMRDGKSMGD